MDFKVFVSKMDLLIRQGRGSEVSQILKSTDLTRSPREIRASLANICLRVGMPEKTLTLLNRYVRAQGRSLVQPTSLEVKEYATALIRVGAADEGIELVKNVNYNDVPEALLIGGIGHFTKWQYKRAIPLLRKYLGIKNLTDYQLAVGQVNLASALIVENNLVEAEALLIKLLQDIGLREDYQLLIGNIFELLTQISIQQGDVKRTMFYIDRARKLNISSSSVSSLFLDKWEAVGLLFNPETKSEGLNKLYSTAEKARRLNHWETLRESHYFLSRAFNDEYSFLKVYFGTPFTKYRERMLSGYKDAPDIPHEFVYHLKSPMLNYPSQLNIGMADMNGTPALAFGGLLHHLLKLLATDFYRPFRVAHIFSMLFSGEYYHPSSSPLRVYQLIKRLRRELDKQGIPLKIEHTIGGYRLSAVENISLLVDRGTHETESEPEEGRRQWLQMEKLKAIYPTGSFDRKSIMRTLNISYRSSSRFVSWAIHQKRLLKVVDNNRVVYQWYKQAS